MEEDGISLSNNIYINDKMAGMYRFDIDVWIVSQGC